MNGKNAHFNLKNEAIYSKVAPNAAEKRPWEGWWAIFQVFLSYFDDEKWPYRPFIRREQLTFFALVFLLERMRIRLGFGRSLRLFCAGVLNEENAQSQSIHKG